MVGIITKTTCITEVPKHSEGYFISCVCKALGINVCFHYDQHFFGMFLKSYKHNTKSS